jgi:integrase
VSIGPEIVSDLIPLLESERKDTGTGRMRRPAPDDLVFVNRQGRPVSQSTFLVHVWQPAVRAFAGDVQVDGKWVPGPGKRPRVHDLRHSHASWQIAAGIPLTWLQVRLGHESISTTSDVYGHLSPDAHAASARAASVALSQASPTVEDPPAIEGSPPPGPA